MEHTLVIRNPACSRAEDVQSEVIDVMYNAMPRHSITELWTPSANRAEIINAIAEAIQPGDRVVVAAGDGTGNAAVNAYMQANADGSQLAFLSYGNFNDMAATFTSKAAQKNPLKLLDGTAEISHVHPLEISKNGEHYYFAMLYATVGWTALAASLFDNLETRENLQSGDANLAKSLINIAKMYFKTRNSSRLPPFYRDDETLHEDVTDILAINGPTMAKIIKSRQSFYAGRDFLRSDIDVASFFKNTPLLGKSGLNFLLGTKLKLPGTRVAEDNLSFTDAELPIQLDGEFSLLTGVNSLRISKDQSTDAQTLEIIKTTK